MSLEEEGFIFPIDDDIFEKVENKKEDKIISKDRTVAVVEDYWFNSVNAQKLCKSADVDLFKSYGYFFNEKYKESKNSLLEKNKTSNNKEDVALLGINNFNLRDFDSAFVHEFNLV
jgi:hypothetical protein